MVLENVSDNRKILCWDNQAASFSYVGKVIITDILRNSQQAKGDKKLRNVHW